MRSISRKNSAASSITSSASTPSGRTPNPCVVCNTWLKFGKLLDYADSVGAAEIATGHYARLVKTADGRTALCRGLDPGKDQSYVLWGIRPDVLARLRFPVGDYRKEEIRRIAERLGLHHVAEKPDSQEICFVPDQDHARFIREQPPAAGHFRGDRHHGWPRGRAGTAAWKQFTIGQRKGLGVAFGEPRVCRANRRPSREKWSSAPRTSSPGSELTARGANWFVRPAGTSWNARLRSAIARAATPAVR